MLPASSQSSNNNNNVPGAYQTTSNSHYKEDAGFYQNVTARFRQANGAGGSSVGHHGGPPNGAVIGFRPSSQAMGGGISSVLNGGSTSGAYSRNSRDELQNRNSYSRSLSGNGGDHPLQHKSPKTQELEEFAAKFEGYQKQRSRRNLQQPTPMLDQLTRESCQAAAVNFSSWLPANTAEHQLTALETNLLKLVQRNDSITRRGSNSAAAISEDSSSGRESVTTVISNCSNETLKYTDRHSSCETLRFSENGDMGGHNNNGGHGELLTAAAVAANNVDEDVINSGGVTLSRDYCDEQYSDGAVGLELARNRIAGMSEDRYGDYMNMSSSGHLTNQYLPTTSSASSSGLNIHHYPSSVSSSHGGHQYSASSTPSSGHISHQYPPSSTASWRYNSSMLHNHHQQQEKHLLARSLSESTSNNGHGVMNAGLSGNLAGLSDDTSASYLSDKLSAFLNESAMRSGGRSQYNDRKSSGHPDWADYVPPEGVHGASAVGDNGLQQPMTGGLHPGVDFKHVKESYASSVERSLRSVPNLMRGYESSSNLSNFGRSSEMSSPRSNNNSQQPRDRRPDNETLMRSASEVIMGNGGGGRDNGPRSSDTSAAASLRRTSLQNGNYPTSLVSDEKSANNVKSSSQGRRKPKLPTPPASPNISSGGGVRIAATPSPPPPPSQEEIDLLQLCSEPLPAPPTTIIGGQTVNNSLTATNSRPTGSAKLNGSDSFTYSNNSSYSSRYNGNSSYVPSSTASVGGYTTSDSMNQPIRRSVPVLENSGFNNSYLTSGGSHTPEKQHYYDESNRSTPPSSVASGRQPASTPKRDSPATIAAKEAPGWQMFLGVRSSTVNFTSEEANKFRAARDSSKTRSLRRDSTNSNKDNHHQQLQEDAALRPKTRRDDIRDISRIKAAEDLRTRGELNSPHADNTNSTTKLRRTESRGRKRPENPNRSPELENINPHQKRSNGGINNKQVSSNHGAVFHPNSSGRNPDKYLGKSISYEEKPTNEDDNNCTGTNASKQHSLHLSRERSLKSISNWWKNSLEAGPAPPPGHAAEWTSPPSSAINSPTSANSPHITTAAPPTSSATVVNPSHPSPPRHNHSHSDSGISSLSGRSSCMSPMSDLSSSSSGSSRTSLRSASIVSASNIPLECVDECVTSSSSNYSMLSGGVPYTPCMEGEYSELCREVLMFSPQDSRLANALRIGLLPELSLYFAESSLEFEIRLSPVNEPESTPRRNQSTGLDESRRKLVAVVTRKIESQRKNQQLLKESTKTNCEFGAEVLAELGTRAQKQEFDKVKLFIEEIDKITSLIIGLSSRLLRTHLAIKTSHQVDKESLEKKDKLEEQLEEARKLRQSIFRRSAVVFNVLGKHLDKDSVDRFGEFVKEKIRLILDTRQQTEVMKNNEDILKCLKEYCPNPSNGVFII